MSEPWRFTADGLLLELHVQPRARRTGFAGRHGERLKLRLATPPVDGKANRELCRYLARCLAVPPARVTICHGAQARDKRVQVRGVTPAVVLPLLQGWLSGGDEADD